MRINKDRILDYNGRYLIELCQSTGLLIANGRLLGDQNRGNFTFCSHQGQSTVDYLLLNFLDFETLSNFEILDFNEYSDHAPITHSFYLKRRTTPDTEYHDCDDNAISRKLVWDSAKVDNFHSTLSSSNEQQMTSDADSEPIDDAVKSFSQFLHDKAFDVFGKTQSHKSPNSHYKKQNKEWFDVNCHAAKRDFKTARNAFNRDKNITSRINFTRARTKYNRVKKKALKNFRLREGIRLNDMAKSEPRKFWKKLKRSYKKKNMEAKNLNIQDLHDHFKNMFGEMPSEQNDTEPDIHQNNMCEELDAEFTYAELQSAVFKQKNNKSSGIDNIYLFIYIHYFERVNTFSYTAILPCGPLVTKYYIHVKDIKQIHTGQQYTGNNKIN